jgi:hypothetical protein
VGHLSKPPPLSLADEKTELAIAIEILITELGYSRGRAKSRGSAIFLQALSMGSCSGACEAVAENGWGAVQAGKADFLLDPIARLVIVRTC